MWFDGGDRSGRADGGRRPAGTRVAAGLLGAAALLVTSCAAEPSTTPPAVEPVGFDVSSNADGLPPDAGVVGWNDDLHRVVVTTDVSPTTVVDSIDAADGEVSVDWDELIDGGDRSLGEPSPLFRPVPPADDVERRLLELAPAGTFVVVDDDGVAGESGVRYLRTLREFYALDDLRAALAAANGERTAEAVQARDDEILAEISDLPGVVEATRTAPGLIAVTLRGASDAEALEDLDGVSDVNVDGVLSFGAEPRQGEQWMIENTGSAGQAGGWPGVVGADTNADAAWEVTTGAGTIVAVVDSGVDLAHADLTGRIWSNPGEACGNGVDDDGNGFVDDCTGWDFGSTDPDPNPDPGAPMTFHGTHVAGLVAAERNGFGVVGMAPDAQVMALKVSDASGNLSTAWVAGAIQYAVTEGADVINLSLGSQPGEPREAHAHVEAAIEFAAANGVVVVAATGNSGVETTYAPVWPADFSRFHANVIAVGASTNSDTAANFSNRGAGLTVWAPGWWLLSSVPGGGHDFSSGTSMASPVVAGTAALVKASGLATSPDRIRTRIVATAASTSAGPRVDAATAVGAPSAPPTGSVLSVSMSGADSLSPGEPSSLDWVIATDDGSEVAGVEVFVAARAGSVATAVDGLVASVSADGAAPVSAVSDMYGSLGVVPIADAARLAGGVRVSATMTLPAADYAFVVRAVDAAGAAASDGYVTYVSVAGSAAAPGGGVLPQDPGASPPPPGPAPSPGSGGGAPGGDGGSVGGAPDGGATGGGGAPVGDGTGGAPVDEAPPPVEREEEPVGATPGTSPPPSGEPADTAPPSEPPAPPTGGGSGDAVTPSPPVVPDPTPPGAEAAPPTSSGPGMAPGGDDGAGPPDAGAGGEVTAPPPPVVPPSGDSVDEPTPPPPPATSGEHSLTSMAPRSAPLWGGVTSVLEGRFPTNTTIWVWYGEGPSSVVRAFVLSDRQLLATAPPTSTAGTRDVVVRFSTDQDHELRLANAFTYLDDSAPGPVIGPPVGGGGGGGSVGGGVDDPIGGGDAIGGVDDPVGGGDAIGDPPAPAPVPPPDDGSGRPPDGGAGDGNVVGGAGEPSVVGRLGNTNLREIRADSALAALARTVWPDHRCVSTCAATRLA